LDWKPSIKIGEKIVPFIRTPNQITIVQTTRRGNCEKSRKEDELNQSSGKYQLGMAQERPEKGLDSTRS